LLEQFIASASAPLYLKIDMSGNPQPVDQKSLIAAMAMGFIATTREMKKGNRWRDRVGVWLSDAHTYDDHLIFHGSCKRHFQGLLSLGVRL
jgi:hypothetical protein